MMNWYMVLGTSGMNVWNQCCRLKSCDLDSTQVTNLLTFDLDLSVLCHVRTHMLWTPCLFWELKFPGTLTGWQHGCTHRLWHGFNTHDPTFTDNMVDTLPCSESLQSVCSDWMHLHTLHTNKCTHSATGTMQSNSFGPLCDICQVFLLWCVSIQFNSSLYT